MPISIFGVWTEQYVNCFCMERTGKSPAVLAVLYHSQKQCPLLCSLSVQTCLRSKQVISACLSSLECMQQCIFMSYWVSCLQNGELAGGGGMVPPGGLTPHAAAALQFWLSQGALNPHVHASYLHSLQLPFGEPLGHPFSGNPTPPRFTLGVHQGKHSWFQASLPHFHCTQTTHTQVGHF